MKFIIFFFLVNELYFAYYPFSNDLILNNTELIVPLVNETNQDLIFVTGNYTSTYIYWLFYKYNDYLEGTRRYIEGDAGYRFNNVDIILTGNKLEYYFFSAFFEEKNGSRIFLLGENESEEYYANMVDDFFIGTLKQLNSYYYLISKKNEIIRIETSFNFTEGRYMFKYNYKQFYEKDQQLYSVSCDICKNNECYICSYFINEKNYGISSYSNEFNLFYKKEYKVEYDSGSPIQGNYFNKILYFKDNTKFITVNAIEKDTIRLRYFESNKDSLINKLNIKNINNDYIDIKNTQIEPYLDSNDIAVLGTDKIIQAFCDEDKIIISIFQFYNEDESVLTVKTFNTELPVKNPKLVIWQNKIVLSLIYKETGNYNSSRFFIFGNPTLKDKSNQINKNINNNDNIKINIFAIEDDLIFSNAFAFCKILSIPEDFVFTDLIDKTEITQGQILQAQNNEIVFKKYKKNINVNLSLQAMMIGDFKNNTFEIFPSNAEAPKEDKINHGGITIDLNINISTCNNGFYEIEFEYGMCTNTRPEGYYLDIENNIFKQCNRKCSECISGSYDDSNMMCLKCIKGYTYDPKTLNCYLKSNEQKENNLKIEPEKNMYFWFFIVIIIISLVIISLYIIVPWCRKKETDVQKENKFEKKEKNIDEKSLLPEKEMKDM